MTENITYHVPVLLEQSIDGIQKPSWLKWIFKRAKKIQMLLGHLISQRRNYLN